jgi:hypothetical protein
MKFLVWKNEPLMMRSKKLLENLRSNITLTNEVINVHFKKSTTHIKFCLISKNVNNTTCIVSDDLRDECEVSDLVVVDFRSIWVELIWVISWVICLA